ncbi:multiple sugar transport system permease protein [Curtobacterium pusillum]|uniref:Multiple sugar transport system permease protein n=1 Tax=Curtobacterium pusillum TaxID=69373 RepID=A0AAW3T9K9_9MICO|nr:carbohydrate ABC transporter permease [Curtobacterium pusillum]MBA8992036.1 multiple sugar transport system permease protein [Curtobacterium pusillum]
MKATLHSTLTIVLAALWFVPTYLIIVNAFTPNAAYTGDVVWFPRQFGLVDNIAAAWKAVDLGPSLLNSLLYAVVAGGIAVLVAALAGFAVAAIPGGRRTFWFWLIYSGALFPAQAFLRPLFTGYAETGLYDTRWGLFLIYIATCVPFSFFIMRNHMLSVPPEINEAAQLDGANWWTVFSRFYLPLSKSALAAAFIFQFVWVWNELLFGITLSYSENIRPVMAALAGLQSNYGTVGPPVVLAGALFVSLPTVVVFLLFQRVFASRLGGAKI